MTRDEPIHVPVPDGLVAEVTLVLWETTSELVGHVNRDGTPMKAWREESEPMQGAYTAMGRAAVAATIRKLIADGWLVRAPGR